MSITMKTTPLAAVFSSLFAFGCCSSHGNSLEHQILTTFKNFTNFSSLLGSITTYEITPQADNGLGEVLVLIAEMLIALSVLVLGAMVVVLLALLTVASPIIQILTTYLPGPGEPLPTLDDIVKLLEILLSPIVNPMLDQMDTAKGANVADHILVKSRAGILGGALGAYLVLSNTAIMLLMIFTHLRVRKVNASLCENCKKSKHSESNNNNTDL